MSAIFSGGVGQAIRALYAAADGAGLIGYGDSTVEEKLDEIGPRNTVVDGKFTQVAEDIDMVDRLVVPELSRRSAVARIAFDGAPVGTRPAGIAIRGAAVVKATAAGVLSVVSDWLVAEDGAYLDAKFGEGRITFTVARDKFMLGFRVGPAGAGWRVWSSDGAKVELGYVNGIGGATNMIPAINMPGVAGDYVNVEVEIGPMVQGAGVNLRTWLDGAGRPAAPGATVMFGADGVNGMVHMNEGQVKVESFGATPVLLKSVIVDDGGQGAALVCGQAEFVGRWMPRYEWGAGAMSTVRQGSAFRCLVSGTSRLDAAVAAPLGMTKYPILAVYVNGGAPSYVTVNIDSSGFVTLANGLDPARVNQIEVVISGIHEADPKWLKGAGLQIQRLLTYSGGKVSPWRDSRPRDLHIGDSITEAVAAKNTPGVSLPANSVGEASYSVLTSRALGSAAVMNGFGGTGLTVGGNGGVPDARTHAFYHMKDRKVGPENIARVFVNLGTNDGGAAVPAATFEAEYLKFVAKLRNMHPGARFYLVRPFNGMYAANIAYVATLTGSVFVDTAGWLVAGDFLDGTHPTPAGHSKIAPLMVAVVRADIAANG